MPIMLLPLFHFLELYGRWGFVAPGEDPLKSRIFQKNVADFDQQAGRNIEELINHYHFSADSHGRGNGVIQFG